MTPEIIAVVAPRNRANGPARDIGAYSVAFDDKALKIGETVDTAPGVKLTRRC